jgi:hypothetical protein
MTLVVLGGDVCGALQGNMNINAKSSETSQFQFPFALLPSEGDKDTLSAEFSSGPEGLPGQCSKER